MLRILTISLLLISAARSARAADQYASLKPLIGTWLVDRDCKIFKDKLLVVFTRLPKTVLAEFHDPKKPEGSLGRADIVNDGEEDHYRVVTSLPNNPVMKALNLKTIAGSLTVSDDADEPDGPGKDYITCSSRVSVLTSLVTIKLRNKYKKATFLFTTESPLGKEQCRGTGVKQPAAKK